MCPSVCPRPSMSGSVKDWIYAHFPFLAGVIIGWFLAGANMGTIF
jgi:hypothetical protein